MKKTMFVLVIAAMALSACTKFTDVTVKTDDGAIYRAHVIGDRVSVPDTGETIPIIKTVSSDGWLYNSNHWTEKDAVSDWFCHRDVVVGKVCEIIPPAE